MSDDTHLQDIRREKIRRLRVIEKQIESFGEDYAPAHLLVEVAQLRSEIGIVESVVSSSISTSISDDLRVGGRFLAYYEQLRSVQQSVAQLGNRLDEFIEETEVWRKDTKQWVILIFGSIFVISLVVVGVVVYILATR